MESIKIAVCQLGNHECGILIDDIKEIIIKGKISKIPDVSNYIEGMINLRGTIYVIYDLRVKFKMTEYKENDLKIVIMNNKNIGFIVDTVTEIIEVNEKDFEEKPDLPDFLLKKFIKKIIKLEGRVIVYLDIERILDTSTEKAVEDILNGNIPIEA